MSRYIDAENLSLTKFHPKQIKINPSEESVISYQLGWNDAIDSIIEFEPTADVVEVKHGHWIKDRLCSTSGGTYGVCRCSVCECYFQDLINEYNYCPNCGADMRDSND